MARADAEAGTVPMIWRLWRHRPALVHSPAGVWPGPPREPPLRPAFPAHPAGGTEGGRNFARPAPSAAACSLDASDRVHLAWQAGEIAYYALRPDDLPKGTGWRGPMGEPAPWLWRAE